MKRLLFLLSFLFSATAFSQYRNYKLTEPPVQNITNQSRKAVVIGMKSYGGTNELVNSLNDADDMASVLIKLGFEVTLLKDNDLDTLTSNLNNWYNSITNNDAALFYFAGHGMEIEGKNYLIPVDVITSEADFWSKAISVESVLSNMDEKHVSFKLLLLDACRDNGLGFGKGNQRLGVTRMGEVPIGTMIGFATSPGHKSSDGVDFGLNNGIFTYYFKQAVLTPEKSVDEIFNIVTDSVLKITNNIQVPYVSKGGVTQNFYFFPHPSELNESTNIGNLSWSTKNLSINHYSNGDEIPEAKSQQEWMNYGSKGIGCWSYYDYDQGNGNKYGKIYNYYALSDYRRIAPQGWHIPDETEWHNLEITLGGPNIAGDKIKARDGWSNQNSGHNGNNESGFTAYPGGFCDYNGKFGGINKTLYLWSITEKWDDHARAYFKSVDGNTSQLNVNVNAPKQWGLYVRCVKNNEEIKLKDLQVTIGTQIWATNNLNVDHYNNGDPIPEAKTEREWITLDSMGIGCWSYYNNDFENGVKYGKIYNYFALSDPRGLTPTGWHIPSDSDWNILATNLGGYDIAGKKIKAAEGWNVQNGGYNGNNESGFTALPGGYRDYNGKFGGIKDGSCMWSITEQPGNSNRAEFKSVNYNSDTININLNAPKQWGFYVRPIKD